MLRRTVDFVRNANSRKSHIARTLAQDSKRSFWAFADQGIVSLGNFGINIMLARYFARVNHLSDYGAFWVLMELMVFVNGIQAAVLIYPISLRGTAMNRLELSRLTTQSLLLTFFISPLLLLSLGITAYVAHLSIIVGIWAAIALLLWQTQEVLRRSLMAHLRFRAAVLGDAISYLGQLAAVLWLAYRQELTLQTLFQSMALTSAISCLVQAQQVHLQKISFLQTLKFGKECCHLSRWVFFSNLTSFFSEALFSWNMAYWVGLETLGIYYAMTNLLRLANPLCFAIGTLIMPNAARAHQKGDLQKAKKVALRFTALGAILLTPYLGLLIIWPKLVIGVFYGWDSTYNAYASLVQICAVAVAFVYIAIAAGTFLNAIQRTRQAFFGDLVFAAGYLIIVMPLTARIGLYGAAWGWLIAAAVRVAVYFYFVESLNRPMRSELPIDEDEEATALSQPSARSIML